MRWQYLDAQGILHDGVRITTPFSRTDGPGHIGPLLADSFSCNTTDWVTASAEHLPTTCAIWSACVLHEISVKRPVLCWEWLPGHYLQSVMLEMY